METFKILAFWSLFAFGSAFMENIVNNQFDTRQVDEKSVEKSKDELQSLMKGQLAPLLSSVHDASKDLNEIIEQVKLQKDNVGNDQKLFTQNLVAFPKVNSALLNQLKTDDCSDFAEDCRDVASIAFNGTLMVVKISMTFTEILTDIIKCPSINLWSTYRCYSNNIDLAKELINDITTNGLPLIKKATAIAKNLLLDINKCVHFKQKPKVQLNNKLETLDLNTFSQLKISQFLTNPLAKTVP